MRTLPVLLLLFLAACSADSQPALVASNVTTTQSLPGMAMSAGYLTLTNNSAETITITRVSSPNYGSVEMHETVITDGVARMRPLEKLDVLPGASTTLEPGGKHLMLMRPVISAEDKLPDSISLDFYDGPDLLLSVTAGKPRKLP